jgi:hypothetical protein
MADLNYSNYHSLEMNNKYMGRSLYNRFLRCEAEAMAYLSGDWVDEPTTALLVGSYLHAWNQGSLSEWMTEHPECFTRSGGLKAEYKQADKMIATLEADPFAMYTLTGQKEVIFTAEFAGCKWKVMADVYNPDKKRIVELKTTRSIREKFWNQELKDKVSFIEQYNYILQAALYSEIERLASGREAGDWFSYYMVAVGKEDCPDKEVIDLSDPQRWAYDLEVIKGNMPRILAVKAGEAEPVRCERCDFCRSTKKLTRAIHYSELA